VIESERLAASAGHTYVPDKLHYTGTMSSIYETWLNSHLSKVEAIASFDDVHIGFGISKSS